MLGLNLLEVVTLNVACKCSSVSRDLITDLLAFMDEKIVHMHMCFQTLQ